MKELIGYEIFIDTELYPTGFDFSWNHKLYITEDDAKMALKDLRNYFYITKNTSSHKVCYRPVYLTSMNYGKFVLEYISSSRPFPHCLRKRVYDLKGINDYKLNMKYNTPKILFKSLVFEKLYNIHRVLYGEPIF